MERQSSEATIQRRPVHNWAMSSGEVRNTSNGRERRSFGSLVGPSGYILNCEVRLRSRVPYKEQLRINENLPNGKIIFTWNIGSKN